MNTRDIGREKAFELLRELGIEPATPIMTERGPTVILNAVTCAFLRGWVHGLQDAQVQAHVAQMDAIDSSFPAHDTEIVTGFEKLKAILNGSRIAPKS